MNMLEKVGFMKMDIGGVNVLEASADKIFSKTAISIIEAHGWVYEVKERVDNIVDKNKEKYNLEVSYNGEFLIVKNMDLLDK